MTISFLSQVKPLTASREHNFIKARAACLCEWNIETEPPLFYYVLLNSLVLVQNSIILVKVSKPRVDIIQFSKRYETKTITKERYYKIIPNRSIDTYVFYVYFN